MLYPDEIPVRLYEGDGYLIWAFKDRQRFSQKVEQAARWQHGNMGKWPGAVGALCIRGEQFEWSRISAHVNHERESDEDLEGWMRSSPRKEDHISKSQKQVRGVIEFI